MSTEETRRDDGLGANVPRLEPWLVVMLIAIAPMLAALALPRELVPHLTTLAGMLFLVGGAMLFVQERRRGAGRGVRDAGHGARDAGRGSH
jgi:hypothetical protein